MVRTRIAPSPTGYPHIGTIYQALFNYAFAKKQNGHFIVRIEDTDRNRFVEGSEEIIYKSLDWIELQEDESPRIKGNFGPYRQSERLEIYHKYAQELIEKDLAYFAYYPKEEAGKKKDYSHKNTLHIQVSTTTRPPPKTINEMLSRKDWIVRMKVPRDKNITVKDEIRGEITFESNQITEQILIKSDGFPTYHLASVVDDHLMEISHVLRAEEWLTSMPKHWLLYEYFGWEKPKFYHTATLRNPDKSKLSKRHGHTNVLWFIDEGFLPQAVLNFLALLGWSHPEEKEIFPLSEFIKLFDPKDIRPVAPIFDIQKLEWMNGEYIRSLNINSLTKAIKDYEKAIAKRNTINNINSERLKKIVSLAQSRINTLKEFYPLAKYLVEKEVHFLENEKDRELAKELLVQFQKMTDWNQDEIFQVFKSVMKKHAIKMPRFYTILTGETKGLPLPESLELLGRDETISRLEKAVKQ